MQPLGSSILPASGRPPSGLMPRLNQPSRLAALQARGLSCPAVRGNSGSFLYRDVPQAGRKATIQPRTCIQVSAVLIVFIAAMENVKWHPGFPAPRTGMPGTFFAFHLRNYRPHGRPFLQSIAASPVNYVAEHRCGQGIPLEMEQGTTNSGWSFFSNRESLHRCITRSR